MQPITGQIEHSPAISRAGAPRPPASATAGRAGWVGGPRVRHVNKPPSGSGADIRTTAIKQGDRYILNGTKTLISHTDIADATYVIAVTDENKRKKGGLTAFLIETNTPGYYIDPLPHMMGCRGAGHAYLRFEDRAVPAHNIMGKEGDGLDIFMNALAHSRAMIAVTCLGLSQRFLELSIKRAKDRVTFGKTLASRQAIQQTIADMGTQVHALRMMLQDCARKFDRGEDIEMVSAMCKLQGIDTVRTVSDGCLEIFGGIGYFEDNPYGPVWCVIWWRRGNNRPQTDTRIAAAELAYIQADRDTVPLAGPGGELSKKDIFSTPAVWACALGYFCTNYLFFLFMTWLPTYFAMGRGIDLKQSAIFSMLPYLVAILAYPLGGVVTDYAAKRFGQNIGRKVSPIGGLLLAGLFLVLGTRAGSLWTASGLICASNFFLCFTMASHFSIPMVFSQKNTGVIVGLNGMFGTVAGIFAPVFSGLIIDLSGHYEYALYLGAGIAILGALILLLAQIKPIEKKWRREGDIALPS